MATCLLHLDVSVFLLLLFFHIPVVFICIEMKRQRKEEKKDIISLSHSNQVLRAFSEMHNEVDVHQSDRRK